MKAPTWTPITCRLGDLKPWAANPRYSTKAQAERILASFKEFGQVQAVAVGPALEVYDGHQRLSALLTLHGPDYEIDARQSSRELTDAERRKLVVTLHTGATGAWDWDSLGNWDAGELQEWGMSADTVKEWNTDAAQLRTMLEAAQAEGADAEPEIDRAAELREKWQTERGQLWAIGEHRLLCGDSTSREDVERVMGGEKAVLMATDPPYGVAYNDETGSGKGDTILNDENDGEKLRRFLESVFSACLPSLSDNCAWYLWHAQMTQGFFAASASAADVLIHRQIIWVKPSLILGHGDYHWRHELCFYGWRKGHRPPFYGQRNQTTVWEIGRESDGLHPTEKPVEIWRRPIENHTKKGEPVIEPFSGSGSQIVACQNLGRKCRAIEISPAYVAVALERMATAFPGLDIHRIDS